jgi:hypothetical protein
VVKRFFREREAVQHLKEVAEGWPEICRCDAAENGAGMQ